VDIRGWRGWSRPFVAFGRNPLAAYFLSVGLDSVLTRWAVGDGAPMKAVLYSRLFAATIQPCCGAEAASLAYAVAYVMLWGVVMLEMRRRGIFVGSEGIIARRWPTSPSTRHAHGLGAAWYRDVTPTQWKAFIGAYLGWVLDGFDFTILTFLLVDISGASRSTRRSRCARDHHADLPRRRRHRRRHGGGSLGPQGPADVLDPLVLGVLVLGGFSTSYGMLFAIRALFGIGMGGVWAAGMPLTLEHWPSHLRGTASGMMQSGYSMGFLLSSLVFEFGYPLVNHTTDMGWRVMLWIGILPAFLVFFIMKGRQRKPGLARTPATPEGAQATRFAVARAALQAGLLMTTLHTSILMGAFLFMYHSITYWYPTLLTQMQRPTLPFLAALNVGAIVGALVCGRMSEGRLGRRGAATIATLVGILVIPLYVFTDNARCSGSARS
jgi:SHS family lactate transporter-like MFS transporter